MISNTIEMLFIAYSNTFLQKKRLKVKPRTQLNPKLDMAAIEEPPLALLWFAKYADYQMHVVKLF